MAAAMPMRDNSDGITDPQGRAGIHFITRNWKRDDLDHLPSGNKYEILDGSLLVTPPASENHQSWTKWLFRHLDRAAPEGWRVHWDIGLDYAIDRCFVPDLVVMGPNVPEAASQWNALVPDLVVEVESKSTKGVDRTDKAEAYAEAGIESYWRVDRKGGITVGRLNGDAYIETAYAPGEPFSVDHPYPVTIPARPAEPR